MAGARNGGQHPVWARSGRELFFSGNDSLYAAATSGPTFGVGGVRALFRLGLISGLGFSVLPGDSLFVMIGPSRSDRNQVVVIANFIEELRSLAATPARR